MDRDEINRLLAADDRHGLALVVTRAWLEKDYPAAKYAATVVELGEGIPPARMVVIPATSLAAAFSARNAGLMR